MKKIILRSFLLLLLTSIFLVVNMPARWLYQQLITFQDLSMLKIQEPKGTIWKGSSSVTTSKIPFKVGVNTISWVWQPKQVLNGSFAYQVELDSTTLFSKEIGNYSALVGVNLDGLFATIKDNNSKFTLNATYTKSELKGIIKLKKPDSDLSNLLKISQIKSDGSFSLKF